MENQIKEILKKYISNEDNLKSLLKNTSLKSTTIKTYATKNKYISQKFILTFSKEKNLSIEDKNFIINYINKFPKKKKRKQNNNKKLLVEIIELLKSTKNIDTSKNTIFQKKDRVIEMIEKNKSDYLKYIELLKRIKKDLSELDVLSSFNLKIKDRSKIEITKLLNKIILEVEEVKRKISNSNFIMEVELIENE